MKEMKRLLAIILAVVMLVGIVPVSAFAAQGDPVVVIAGSDYQSSSSATYMKNIVAQMGYSSIDGVLMGGDYNGGGTTWTTANLVATVDAALTTAGVSTSADRIFVQGNHDYQLSPSSSSNLLSAEGKHDTDAYGVYVINQEDFPWDYYSITPSPSETLVKGTADANGGL
jgi:hypothetical protein